MAFSSNFLETLVKLAAAGTSGICILAIFASGYILLKLNEDTPPRKYKAIHSFMKMTIGVAIISAGTTIAAGYWDYKSKISLREANNSLRESAKLKDSVIEQKSKQTVVLENQLESKNNEISNLAVEFMNIRPGQKVSTAKWTLINANLKRIGEDSSITPKVLDPVKLTPKLKKDGRVMGGPIK